MSDGRNCTDLIDTFPSFYCGTEYVASQCCNPCAPYTTTTQITTVTEATGTTVTSTQETVTTGTTVTSIQETVTTGTTVTSTPETATTASGLQVVDADTQCVNYRGTGSYLCRVRIVLLYSKSCYILDI